VTESRATLRYHRASAPKARQALSLIRGADVEEARRRLRFADKDAAVTVLKLLESAISNAEHNNQIPADELFVQTAYAHEGPTQKRMRPRARGRASRIRKRTCHITIIVERFTDDQQKERARREALQAKSGKRQRQPLRRRRRIRTEEHEHTEDEMAEGAEPLAEEQPVEDVVEDVVEEKPKRTRKKASEKPAEKPKPKRTRAKKTEGDDQEKPKRSRRKSEEGE